MTPYPEETNEAEKKFLEDNGITVTSITGVGFNKVGEYAHPGKAFLYRQAKKLKTEGAEVFFLSCMGLATMELDVYKRQLFRPIRCYFMNIETHFPSSSLRALSVRILDAYVRYMSSPLGEVLSSLVAVSYTPLRCYTGVICGNDGSNGSADTTIRSGEADLSWLTKELGERYLIMDTLLKHWPANMWVQTPVELVNGMAQEHGFGPDDIEEIILDPPIRNRMWAPDEGFTSVTHAQFSAPYVIATMLLHPEPGAFWYTPEMMKDREVIALAKRVKPGTSPEDSPMTGFKQFRNGSYPMKTITVTVKDGRTFNGSMDCHPGHPANMMGRGGFVSRFRIQVAPVLQGEKLEQVIETICNIEHVDDIASVSGMLA